MSTKRVIVAAAGAAWAVFAAVAVDLPWVYDSSERTVVDARSAASASPAGAFATMAGHWSYRSTTSRIRSTPWPGITIVVL